MDRLEGFDIRLSSDDVLHGEGVDPQIARLNKPSLLAAAEDALQEGHKKIHPVAVTHQIKVIEHHHERIFLQGGKELTSPLVAHHLSGANEVVLVVCTIGPELEDYAASRMNENPLLGISLDGLGNAAVEILGQLVCTHLGEKALAADLTVSTPLSPGDSEWPVDVGQQQIFALLDPSQIGIKLTSGGMMIPKKSISFVVGIGRNMVQTDPCELCSLRERCRYRHA